MHTPDSLHPQAGSRHGIPRTTLWLLTLLLLAACAGAGGQEPHADVRSRAVNWLLAQPTSGPGQTAAILIALGRLPQPQGEQIDLGRLLSALAEEASTWPPPGDTGLLAKAVLAVAAGGGDPHAFANRDLVAELSATYQAETGLFHPESLYRHMTAMQALAVAAEPVPPPALAALLRTQQADGGWGWRMAADGRPAGPSDVDSTAQALLVLAEVGFPPQDQAVTAALAFLAQNQTARGGWAMDANSLPNANSTGLTLQALGRLGQDATWPAGMRSAHAQRWLVGLQQADGSFHYAEGVAGSVLMATVEAVPVFQWQFLGED